MYLKFLYSKIAVVSSLLLRCKMELGSYYRTLKLTAIERSAYPTTVLTNNFPGSFLSHYALDAVKCDFTAAWKTILLAFHGFAISIYQRTTNSRLQNIKLIQKILKTL